MNKERKPSWWKLATIMVIILAALYLVTTAHVSPFGRKLLEIGVILLGFTLIVVWIYSNAASLEVEARSRHAERRQPWHPAWWRPGLNRRQRYYLRVKYGASRQPPEERIK